MTVRTEAVMGTLVTIHVVRFGAEAAIERAFQWFHQIEHHCTRFEPRSELMQLTTQIGVAVPVSSILYEAIRFALTVAEESGGAFDPTIGHSMETRGFNREYRSGEIVRTVFPPKGSLDGDVSYRDVCLHDENRSITLKRPLTLDLGAVAKGLAVDTAARELQPFADFMIDAGGDLYVGGCNANGKPWSVGIRHPRQENELIDRLSVSNQAICTSGDYERRTPLNDGQHHILDPRSGESPHRVTSATVVAPTAMLADALATAAFVLGPEDGIEFLQRQGVEGLIVSSDMELHETLGLKYIRSA